MRMKFAYFLLILFFTTVNNFYYAQESKIDSLLSVLKAAKDDTLKVKTQTHLIKRLILSGNFDAALELLKSSLQLADNLNTRTVKFRSTFCMAVCVTAKVILICR